MQGKTQVGTELLPFDGSAMLMTNFLGADSADRYLDELLQNNPWEQRAITMFG